MFEPTISTSCPRRSERTKATVESQPVAPRGTIETLRCLRCSRSWMLDSATATAAVGRSGGRAVAVSGVYHGLPTASVGDWAEAAGALFTALAVGAASLTARQGHRTIRAAVEPDVHLQVLGDVKDNRTQLVIANTGGGTTKGTAYHDEALQASAEDLAQYPAMAARLRATERRATSVRRLAVG